MDLAEGPVIGGTIPGIPAVLIGRNAELGWGLTSSYLDDQDVYVERLNPDDPDAVPDAGRAGRLRRARGARSGSRTPSPRR